MVHQTDFVEQQAESLDRMVFTYIQEIKTRAKSIDSCQPAQTAQADMSRYFLQMPKGIFSSKSELVIWKCYYPFKQFFF